MPSDRVETLWGQVLMTVGHLMHDIDLLEQQFHRFRTDPTRVAGTPEQRFIYKLNINYWYRCGMPRAKAQLLQEIASYWTMDGAGIQWMRFYNEERVALDAKDRTVVESRMENYTRLLKQMEENVVLMFTDMRRMVMLNPGWSGSEGDRFFNDDGPVRKTGGVGYSWIDWTSGNAPG